MAEIGSIGELSAGATSWAGAEEGDMLGRAFRKKL